MRKVILSLASSVKRWQSIIEQGEGKTVAKKGLWGWQLYLRLLVLIAVITITVIIFLFRDQITHFQSYGYAGLFVMNVLTSATLFMPLPTGIIVFALGAVLNPLLVGIAAGSGAGLGETTGYLLGYSGQTFAEKSKVYTRLERWMRRRGSIVIFLISLVPNPFVDIAGFIAGVLRYPIWKFLIFCMLGKTLRSIVFALAGYWGLNWVINSWQRIF